MPGNEPSDTQWRPHPFQLPTWIEPMVVITILISTMWLTRTTSKDYILIPDNRSSKLRRFCGIIIETPNTTRFAKHFHSSILQKFPFLVEMFYFGVQLLAYQFVTNTAASYHGGSSKIWDVAQAHALSILKLESYIIPDLELNTQRWFLQGAIANDWRGTFMTILNRSYALLHIPSTAIFVAVYYATSPSFSRFAAARRTMTLSNFIAFTIFLLYPCMPPRLLPEEYGFTDTVNGEDATSVWMSENYVNRLAAMPSMHFGYAFWISCVLIYESRPVLWLRSKDEDEENQEFETQSLTCRATCFIGGIWYMNWVLLSIIATANHYIIDAMAAVILVGVSFACNKALLIFLPLEDCLLWILRLDKPIPTTGLKRWRDMYKLF